MIYILDITRAKQQAKMAGKPHFWQVTIGGTFRGFVVDEQALQGLLKTLVNNADVGFQLNIWREVHLGQWELF
jgi:hypothetical protein